MQLNIIHLATQVLLAIPSSCHPQSRDWRNWQVDATTVQDTYDYIVVGGGQSGLVVANRLSEDASASVLVVEYGHFDNNPEQIQPSSVRNGWPPQDLYNLSSVPQVALLNRVQKVYSAAVVGGGSTVNGMMLHRGAADDYNNWALLNNDTGWSFEGLLPYFVKPSQALVDQFNMTWDADVYGQGPIHVSFARFQYPGLLPQWAGMEEVGVAPQVEGAGGHGYGVYWYPNAIDDATVTRSYAVSGYYAPVAERPNLSLLTGHRVNEILLDETLRATSILVQPRGDHEPTEIMTLEARKEIVLAAGALHSPQILQRSGVGPSALLRDYGIKVLVDLPGVGSNLQDHPINHLTFNYTKNLDPNPTDMQSNASFIEWASQVWEESRKGPLSTTTGNTAAVVPLRQVAPDTWDDIARELSNQNATLFLPQSYTKEQIAGYEAQRLLLADSFSRTDNAVVEVPFSGASSFILMMTKEVSRGTVLLDPDDWYGNPIVDYHTFENPVDSRIMVESFKFGRRWHQTAAIIQTFAPVEDSPGVNITSDEALLKFVTNTTSSSTGHMSGTCAMMPRHLGGVVGPDLLVHGITGLSIVDASIIPLIPGAHTCGTVYAIAEKAADLIKRRHRAKPPSPDSFNLPLRMEKPR
ncbi:hypothetical protein JX266_012677 [Neoarthrinium moseri]|nr:hypothetical protein JX266_012677 [Neoarthrinium moseri]